METFFRFDNVQEDDCIKPTIVYSAYFEIPCSTKGHDYTDAQDGPIYFCSGAYNELDYDESIQQSKVLYTKMYPEDEFLPKAPEPEEIIIGDEDESNPTVNLGVLADLVDKPENKDDTGSAEELTNESSVRDEVQRNDSKAETGEEPKSNEDS